MGTFYAVLICPDMGESTLSENSIINELRSEANKNLLFFQSEKDAVKYCKRAKREKYLYKSKEAHDTFQKAREARSNLPKRDKSNPIPTQEDLDRKGLPFYEPVLDGTQSQNSIHYSILIPHQTAKTLLILTVELEANDFTSNRWLLEETHYLLSNYLGTTEEERGGKQLITLTNKPFTASNTEDYFNIECRKGSRYNILSLCQAQLYTIENGTSRTVTFSPQFQKLTLLRDYISKPTEEKLITLIKVMKPDELHAFFGLLLKENIKSEKLMAAKDALISAYIRRDNEVTQQEPIQPQPQPPEPKPIIPVTSATKEKKSSIHFGWKIALVVFTAGLALIVYGIIKLIGYYQHKNSQTHSSCTLPSTAPSTAPSEISLPPLKRTSTKNPELEQKEFDFNKVQQGMFTFWNIQRPCAGTAGHRDPSYKSRLYKPDETETYKAHLQQKQVRRLSLNKRGELRKKIEFQKENKVLVTGTRQQIERWELYAVYADQKYPQKEHGPLFTNLDESWSESSNFTKAARNKRPF